MYRVEWPVGSVRLRRWPPVLRWCDDCTQPERASIVLWRAAAARLEPPPGRQSPGRACALEWPIPRSMASNRDSAPGWRPAADTPTVPSMLNRSHSSSQTAVGPCRAHDDATIAGKRGARGVGKPRQALVDDGSYASACAATPTDAQSVGATSVKTASARLVWHDVLYFADASSYAFVVVANLERLVNRGCVNGRDERARQSPRRKGGSHRLPGPRDVSDMRKSWTP